MKQKIEKLKKFHSIRFSLTSVVALLILLSVFISSTLSYSRYTRDFQEQSSEQIDQTLEQLSINLSTYLDELFRLTVYLYYDDSGAGGHRRQRYRPFAEKAGDRKLLG